MLLNISNCSIGQVRANFRDIGTVIAVLLKYPDEQLFVMSDPTLTDREADVLHWAAQGKSAWEIGVILSISERTVKFHLGNIYRKFGVRTRAQALVHAMKMELLN